MTDHEIAQAIREASTMMLTACSRMNDNALQRINDGGYELNPVLTYFLSANAGFYLLSAIHAHKNGHAFDWLLRDAIEGVKAAKAVAALTDPKAANDLGAVIEIIRTVREAI
jgi:hypothetical protein